MQVLVTGGTGFVGSHIVRALNEAGERVRVLHRRTSRLDALAGLAYESAHGDITDGDALRAACDGCDVVFHVAAVADYWRADAARMFDANVNGTRTVLRTARAAGVRRVVFTSSAAAVGVRADAAYADERDLFNLSPRDFPYGYSKALAERVVADAVAQGQDVVTLNPVVIVGPGDLNMISGSFIVQTRRYGRWTPMTVGGVAVVDVRDVARAHLAAAARGRPGERYIVGAQNVSYREWFGMIADAVGVPRPLLLVPGWLTPAIAAGIDLARVLRVPLPVDAAQARLGARTLFYRFDKAWTELGAPQVDMTSSLRDTVAWYTAHGMLA